ncbi:MAG: NUDIX hydrolase [Candidatus Woesebacteria bacterium GW2011_GWA1_45_8]|uniref:NUDIX hydrolase n=1 Tax=Candidatus Woesebacteria bacterium GW2011_GWA1_45_8 TaxID=1618559 RepID=A0A0G1MW63_9BACT|nr:MAG: NUDIX hydrolase [Candidatus Woesebacteria bacterium GW2011_GWA1_45_8]
MLYKDGKLLVVENRKPRSGFFGHVIFPGGEIEKGETPEEAVMREATEELGVDSKDIVYLDTFEDVTLNLGYHRFHAYLVLDFEGEVKNKEPEKGTIQWITLGEARKVLKLVSSRHPLNLAERYINEQGSNKG